ncbi:hypothetical protein H109_00136 [Trichophyton interdigitale MR816]|uniref:Uncharacterized protein n=1 Tax=Trichophyton interdigitale (strain MR816) TaxID=1215338 RepID=A0A059JJM4_TRIIM|nr:hypothetical protein H101_05818 [Trichophyton interdigitale H6]KDB28086.1 hypothetical protein H109_00136 [Trichophyton interdigitale MR816]
MGRGISATPNTRLYGVSKLWWLKFTIQVKIWTLKRTIYLCYAIVAGWVQDNLLCMTASQNLDRAVLKFWLCYSWISSSILARICRLHTVLRAFQVEILNTAANSSSTGSHGSSISLYISCMQGNFIHGILGETIAFRAAMKARGQDAGSEVSFERPPLIQFWIRGRPDIDKSN